MKATICLLVSLISPFVLAVETDKALKVIQRDADENEVKLLNNRFRIDHKVDEITLLFFRKRGSSPVILIRPDGSKMYATQGVTGEIEWYDDLTYDIIKIKKPMPGPWQAVGDILPESKILVLSEIELQVDPLPELMFKGETIKLIGKLTNGGQPITSGHFRDVVTLDVDFVSTNNSELNNFGAETVRVAEFKDDGKGFDEYPGDAVFTGEFKLNFASGQWRPEFYLITPLVERRLVHEPVMLEEAPFDYTLTLAEAAEPEHVLKIKIDETKVDPKTILFQGKIYYPNNEEQAFSIPANETANRTISLINYDWGNYSVEFSAFGTSVNGREFMIDIDNYTFRIDPPIEDVEQKNQTTPNSENDIALDKTNNALLEQQKEPEIKTGKLITIILIGNLVILIIGGLFFRLVVQNKPLFKFNFKFKSKKSVVEEEPSFDDSNEKSKSGRKSNDNDEILNLSISDD
ncbi:TIGR03503 family protein [Pseudoalteromonas sp. NBT06-2]|uniref:TIGR03503 family protein n=1 Tax=Pseudoalteromonas sp. NBT06-2 TaxID=2025950 RepID=UPI000BA5C220|nr:TIGR03503 family protein [Pseudoalteromonas sp. NBT06-2]PAJ74357.1 TIGR03503 family protein [Pseudoalteromonas sp. NBT06-2]